MANQMLINNISLLKKGSPVGQWWIWALERLNFNGTESVFGYTQLLNYISLSLKCSWSAASWRHFDICSDLPDSECPGGKVLPTSSRPNVKLLGTDSKKYKLF